MHHVTWVQSWLHGSTRSILRTVVPSAESRSGDNSLLSDPSWKYSSVTVRDLWRWPSGPLQCQAGATWTSAETCSPSLQACHWVSRAVVLRLHREQKCLRQDNAWKHFWVSPLGLAGGGGRDATGTWQVALRDTPASYSAHEGHLHKDPSGPLVNAAGAEKPTPQLRPLAEEI